MQCELSFKNINMDKCLHIIKLDSWCKLNNRSLNKLKHRVIHLIYKHPNGKKLKKHFYYSRLFHFGTSNTFKRQCTSKTEYVKHFLLLIQICFIHILFLVLKFDHFTFFFNDNELDILKKSYSSLKNKIKCWL